MIGALFIELVALDPSFVLDIRYATPHNFTGKTVYPTAQCFLRSEVARALVRVQHQLKRKKLRLKVWDCYRPFSVQKKFWAIMPDERYVAKPVEKDGIPIEGSKHNRGAAVDLTLIDAEGNELEMPSAYDDFSEKAHRDNNQVSPVARANMQVLERAMVNEGFVPLPTEWWHFDAKNFERFGLSDWK